jgi:hypothetical protein
MCLSIASFDLAITPDVFVYHYFAYVLVNCKFWKLSLYFQPISNCLNTE